MIIDLFSAQRQPVIQKRYPAADGQGLVEYALILVFVAVVIVLILTILGPGISNIYTNIVRILQGQ